MQPVGWCSLLGPPLVGGVVATAGVLVSLHAATVRQAQQTLSVASPGRDVRDNIRRQPAARGVEDVARPKCR